MVVLTPVVAATSNMLVPSAPPGADRCGQRLDGLLQSAFPSHINARFDVDLSEDPLKEQDQFPGVHQNAVRR